MHRSRKALQRGTGAFLVEGQHIRSGQFSSGDVSNNPVLIGGAAPVSLTAENILIK
jgi:hypothetical protein